MKLPTEDVREGIPQRRKRDYIPEAFTQSVLLNLIHPQLKSQNIQLMTQKNRERMRSDKDKAAQSEAEEALHYKMLEDPKPA